MARSKFTVLLVSFLIGSGAAFGQVLNPADVPKEQERRPEEQAVEAGRLRSWELPPVEVVGEERPQLREEERIGKYKQPRWTARRRFGRTRVYVRPEGEYEFEVWFIPVISEDGKVEEIETQYEFEFGLPHRLQVDLYLVPLKTYTREGGTTVQTMGLAEQKFEIRWALADWGAIPGNPTLYFEYGMKGEEDKVEAKLLLADQTPIPGLHWGLNGVYEKVLGSEGQEFALTAGISQTIVDEKFSLGAEVEFKAETGEEETETELWIGPSLQIRPSPPSHFDLAALVDTGNAPRTKLIAIFGWEF
ncbi:MAG: hypothetical protein KatS3mg115_1202 [Candidatus Poribacteria bacterium]|nr:MAG: hypothetical protein KatS3mg115_1202 [Candidatus Poribacteria bacterium]